MIWKVVRPPAWAVFRTVSRLYLASRRNDYRYVFILGHMRSGSTLLAHILGTHPDVVCAGEMHISYVISDDFANLTLKASESLHRPILRATYIVDQINHDYVTDDVLQSNRLFRSVILIREPEASLKSMMNMLECQENEAVALYTKRLKGLARYGTVLGERAMVIEYDDLVDNSKETLAGLTKFIGLGAPLTVSYSTHRMTGRVSGYGDPSSNIKTGQIIRTIKHEITIGEDTLAAAASAFTKCREHLRKAGVKSVNSVMTSTKSFTAAR